VFKDPQMHKPLEIEVSTHGTRDEAYRLTAMNDADCRTDCLKHLRSVVWEKLQPMLDEQNKRATKRDKERYGHVFGK